MSTSTTPPVALTIAGSDSGGGAGLQADLATFSALGVHGTAAVTAVTVQDTTGVHGIHLLPAELVVAQVQAVVTDLQPAAVKTGMLGDVEVVRTVGALAARGLLPRLVVDPVLVATSGHRLAGHGVVAAMTEHLFPHAEVVTPNVEEAAVLLGCEPARNPEEQAAHARALLELGCRAAVVTGGRHLPSAADADTRGGAQRVDVLADASGVRVLAGQEIATSNDHGTGCTYASAIAASLARSLTVPEAVQVARSFVRQALLASAPWRLGRGRGPVSHLHVPQLSPAAPPVRPAPSTDTPQGVHP